MREIMTSMVMHARGGPLEKVNVFPRVNNAAAATYVGLVDAIDAKETCKDMLEEARCGRRRHRRRQA